MTNQDILQIAMAQSAIDSGCAPADFLSNENRVVISRPHSAARRYLELPFLCDLTSYGTNIVASVSPAFAAETERYINKYPAYHCFETPNLHVLAASLRPLGADICFMAEYWLPDVTRLSPLPCRYKTRVLQPPDFDDLYQPAWSNALCDKRKELDTLGIGAYDGDQLIALAACSRDCDTMWQIGIDVLPGYRRQGLASALTERLATLILEQGIVPFYCCAWSNIPSARNAFRSGFSPAWVQVTAKETCFIQNMNQ